MRANLFVAFLLCASCGGAPPKAPPPKPAEELDPSALSRGDKTATLFALSQPYRKVSSAFGPAIVSLHTSTRATLDKNVTSLEEDILIEADASGAIHLQRDNNTNLGFDAFLTKDQAIVQNRYGPARPTPRETTEALIDDAEGPLHAALSPLLPWLAFQPNGDKEVLGKKGLVLQLHKIDGRAPTVTELSPEQAWHATIDPQEISGEIVIDPKTGFVLAAQLHTRFNAEREKQAVSMESELTLSLSKVGEEVALAPLPEVEPLPPRPRLEKDRLDLIGKAALQQQKEEQKKAAKKYYPSSQKTTDPSSQPK